MAKVERRRCDPVSSEGVSTASSSAAQSKEDLKLISLEEIGRHNTPESSWGVFEGKVYDLTAYIKSGEHPGGSDILQDVAGTDFTEAFLDVGHSSLANGLLESFVIGRLADATDSVAATKGSAVLKNALGGRATLMQKEDKMESTMNGGDSNRSVTDLKVTKDGAKEEGTKDGAKEGTKDSTGSDTGGPTFFAAAKKRPLVGGLLNLEKPVIRQIYSMSAEEYRRLCSTFCCTRESVTFFSNPWLEVFTKVPWWVVPSVWLPVAAVLLVHTLKAFHVGTLTALLLSAVGLICWTLAEYGMHRFVFHFNETFLPDLPEARVLHFVVHSVHHLLPFDPMRIVMPPLLLISLMTPFYWAFSSIFPVWMVRSAWPGVLLGYVMYDMVHFLSHVDHAKPIFWLSFMKRYHMKHHFKDSLRGFGVSVPFWDYVFQTAL